MAGIRAARRGALASTVIFGPLVLLATIAAPRNEAGFTDVVGLGAAVALISLPGLALLGAGLASSAVGSRTDAAVGGLAMGIGVPVASVTSALIGAFLLGEIAGGMGRGSVLAGDLLRAGVTAALGISPLVALGSAAWVLGVRRYGQPGEVTAEDPTLSPGRGPRHPDG